VSKFFSALGNAEREFANATGTTPGRACPDGDGPGIPVETGQRVARWLEETPQILGMLRLLLAENEQLRARVHAAEQEGRTLRATLEEATTALTRLVSETLAPHVTRLQSLPTRPGGAPASPAAAPDEFASPVHRQNPSQRSS
jgi:hypothetical protein